MDNKKPEEWKFHPIYSEYAVSTYGNVYNHRTKKYTNKNIHKSGYVMTGIRIKKGETHNKYIHNLVLETFVGPKPKGCICKHYPDPNKSNNHIDNLSWVLRQQNSYNTEYIKCTDYELSEVWKDHPIYTDYMISSYGQVYSYISKKYLKPRLNPAGYLCLGIKIKTGIRKTFRIHTLVLETFVGPRPENMVARHFPDQTKTNNFIGNLSWATQTQNIYDSSSKLTEKDILKIKEQIKNGESILNISKEFNVDKTTIHNIKNNISWVGIGEDISQISSFKSRKKKLTINDVKLIKLLLVNTKLTQPQIGKMFNVYQTLISKIKLKQIFEYIEQPKMSLLEAAIKHENNEEIV